MGKPKGVSADELKVMLKKMKRAELLEFLKGHHLLRPCSKDHPSEWPQVGELVWARNFGSVYWPAFIAQVEDIETDVEGADEVDDDAYRFVMFLESDFRIAPIPWEHIIPVREGEIQEVLFPLFNKTVVKRTWKPTTCYRKSLAHLREFSGIEPSKRQEHAVNLYQSKTKGKKGVPPPKQLANVEKALPVKPVGSAAAAEAEKKRQDGLRVSERIVHKITKNEEKSQLKETAKSKTELDVEVKAAVKGSRNKTDGRPQVGGEPLKLWVHDKFKAIDKQFHFASNPVCCGTCKNTMGVDSEVKMCHGIPHHVNCVKHTDDDGVRYKCQMCRERQCFLCRKSDPIKVTSEKEEKQQRGDTKKPIKCTKCDLRFHLKCLEKWPQAEIQGAAGPIVCPLHFCHTCLGEQRINSQTRDYTVTASKVYRCSLCLSAYHRTCVPAGCGEQVEGKGYIKCPKHNVPGLAVKQRRIGCLTCCKALKPKEDRVECTMCIQIFHPECTGYVGKTKEKYSLKEFGEGYHCTSCFWGLFPVYGQVVWYQQSQSQYWPARILYPKEFRSRDHFAKRLPGQFSIEYFGNTSFYDNASRVIPLHLTTLEIFKSLKVYQDIPKIQRAHEEAAFFELFSDELRPEILPAPKPVYKQIKRNIYRTSKTFSVEKNIKTDSHEGMCSCASDAKAEEVCLPDSGCHNRDTEMECSDKTCEGGERCSNRMFQRRVDDEPFLQLVPMKNKGWGILAKVTFKCGEFVGEYRGEVIDAEEKTWRLERKGEEDPLYILEIDKGLYIDAEYMGSLSRLINHSCDPNCEIRRYASSKGRAVGGIFALRAIQQGEEITFNYAYGNESNAPFRCHCGTKKCSIFIGKRVPDGFRIEEDTNEEIDAWNDTCSQCGFGGRVICCDYPDCRKVCHYQCVGLKRPPSKDWCCPDHPEGVITKKKSPNQKLARAKISSAATKNVNLTNQKTPKIKEKPLKSEPGSLKRKLTTVLSSFTQTTQPKQRRSVPTLTVSPPQKRKRESRFSRTSEPSQKEEEIVNIRQSRIPALLETPKSARKKAPVLRNSKTNLCDDFGPVIPPCTPPSAPLPVPHRQHIVRRKTEGSDVPPMEKRRLFAERLTRRHTSVQSSPAKRRSSTRSSSSPSPVDFDGENKGSDTTSIVDDEIESQSNNTCPSEMPLTPQEDQDSVLTRSSHRVRSLRNQNQSKGSGPFSPLVLNSITQQGAMPPVYLTDSLVPATVDKNTELTVGIRTRTSPRKSTSQFFQVDRNPEQTGREMIKFPPSAADGTPLLTVEDIKQEPCDDDEESQISSPPRPRNRTRFSEMNSGNSEDAGFVSDVGFTDTDTDAETETDSDLELVFIGPPSLAIGRRNAI
ncbi:unnamed protein product [Orchesella dallaii]